MMQNNEHILTINRVIRYTQAVNSTGDMACHPCEWRSKHCGAEQITGMMQDSKSTSSIKYSLDHADVRNGYQNSPMKLWVDKVSEGCRQCILIRPKNKINGSPTGAEDCLLGCKDSTSMPIAAARFHNYILLENYTLSQFTNDTGFTTFDMEYSRTTPCHVLSDHPEPLTR